MYVSYGHLKQRLLKMFRTVSQFLRCQILQVPAQSWGPALCPATWLEKWGTVPGSSTSTSPPKLAGRQNCVSVGWHGTCVMFGCDFKTLVPNLTSSILKTSYFVVSLKNWTVSTGGGIFSLFSLFFPISWAVPVSMGHRGREAQRVK